MPKRGEEAEGDRANDGIDAQQIAQPDAAVCGVGDAAAEEDDAVDDDIGADDAAGDADEHSGCQRVAHESVLQRFNHADTSM